MLKWAQNTPKGQKWQFRTTLRAKRRQKSFSNQIFLYETLFTYVLAVYTWIFVPKFKKSYFERGSVRCIVKVSITQKLNSRGSSGGVYATKKTEVFIDQKFTELPPLPDYQP